MDSDNVDRIRWKYEKDKELQNIPKLRETIKKELKLNEAIVA